MTLQSLLRRISIPPKGDYVRSFQELVVAAQEHALRRDEASRLRVAEAAFTLGDYGRALEEVRRLAVDQPSDARVCRLRGMAALGAVATATLKVPAGPGAPPPDVSSPASLLDEAEHAFQKTLEMRPRDERARLGLQATQLLRSESLAVQAVSASV